MQTQILLVQSRPTLAIDFEVPLATTHWVENLDQALAYLARQSQILLIALVQSHPEQYTQADVERLRAASPLARIACVAGPWCEGAQRTGRPLHGVWRIYWHQQGPRLSRELRNVAAGQSAAWSFPLTSSEDERLIGSLATDKTFGLTGLRILIEALSTETRDALFSALSSAGAEPIQSKHSPTARDIDVIIWDDEGRSHHPAGELRSVASHFKPTPILAILGFPREDEYIVAKDGLPIRILAKPFQFQDLEWEVLGITGRVSVDSTSLYRAG